MQQRHHCLISDESGKETGSLTEQASMLVPLSAIITDRKKLWLRAGWQNDDGCHTFKAQSIASNLALGKKQTNCCGPQVGSAGLEQEAHCLQGLNTGRVDNSI